MIDDPTAAAFLRNRQRDKGLEMLMGIVTGMVVDDHLHDLEIQFLSSWLADHADITAVWPGSAVATLLKAILADGVITEAERAHMLVTLKALTANDFANTGSATPEVIGLPLDELCAVQLRDANVCHTGEFLLGTRTRCEQLSAHAGAMPFGTVTRKIAYLIIGTNVSPHWAHTSYGRKIEQAIGLQQEGHPIKIISERRWQAALDVLAGGDTKPMGQ